MSSAYADVGSLRDRDRFHADQDRAALLETFFPDTTTDLVLDLSKVTSLFYGLLLQVTRDRFGAAEVDQISRELFYRLGRMKSRATRSERDQQYPFHGDARDLVTVLISAIYDASPEYEFVVEQYEPDVCVVMLAGADRYYRAASSLGIAHLLTWPALEPFFHGINDELGLQCRVRSELLAIETDARLRVRYVFEKSPNAVGAT
jgi:hypothetical protein